MFTTDDRNLLRGLLTLWAGVETLLMRQGFRLDRIETRLRALQRAEKEITMTLDDVIARLQGESTVVGSIELVVTQLVELVRQAQATGDPAKLQQALDLIDQNTGRLTAAAVAGTPAAPAAPTP